MPFGAGETLVVRSTIYNSQQCTVAFFVVVTENDSIKTTGNKKKYPKRNKAENTIMRACCLFITINI